MSDFASLTSDLILARDSDSPLSLGGGRIAQLLDSLQIIRELSQLATIPLPASDPEGMRQRLEIIFSAAAKSAELTATQLDDVWVANVRKEIMVPPVLGILAYAVERAQGGYPGV